MIPTIFLYGSSSLLGYAKFDVLGKWCKIVISKQTLVANFLARKELPNLEKYLVVGSLASSICLGGEGSSSLHLYFASVSSFALQFLLLLAENIAK